MGAYDYIAPDVRPSGSLGGADPPWVVALRAQHAQQTALELRNPEGVRAREESTDAARRRESEYLFALATGSTGAQLGADGLRSSSQRFLDPNQTAQLLGLRAGADPAQVLTGGAAGYSAQAASMLDKVQSSPLALGVAAVAAVLVLKKLATSTLVIGGAVAAGVWYYRKGQESAA